MAKQSRTATNPDPGFYLLRLVPGGWPVPARIIQDGDKFGFEIDGADLGLMPREALSNLFVDWLTAEKTHPVARMILFGEKCEEPEYLRRVAMKEWARTHDRDHPCLHPEKRIVPRLVATPDF